MKTYARLPDFYFTELQMESHMKLSQIISSFAAAVITITGLVSSAHAGLNSHYSNGNMSFGYYTDTYYVNGKGGETKRTSVGSHFNSRIGDVTSAQTNYYYTEGNNTVFVSTYIDGRKYYDPMGTPVMSQDFSFSIDGKHISQHASTGYYNATGGKGLMDVTTVSTPEWWSTGNAGVTFDSAAVTSMSANGGYSEYYDEYNLETRTLMFTTWNLEFGSTKGAAEFASAMSLVATTVPEPTTACAIFGFSSLVLRRRR